MSPLHWVVFLTYVSKFKFVFSVKPKNAKIEKHGCQKLVAMATLKSVITWCKGQNISRTFLGKIAKFGGDSFNRREFIHLQTWRGRQRPKASPPGLNRVKQAPKLLYGANTRWDTAWNTYIYFPTESVRWVQITPTTSTNITRYLYSKIGMNAMLSPLPIHSFYYWFRNDT